MRTLIPLFLSLSSCSLLVDLGTDVPFCGDGILDTGEQCDDANQDDTDGCTVQCTFPCGNQVAELGQVCDGADLKGQSCASLGFDSGALTCAPDCSTFDATACVAEVCTNGQDDGGDGLIDCIDIANCQSQCNDACELPTVAAANGGNSGSTLNHADTRTGSCQTAGGGDVAFQVDITTTGVLRLSLASATEQGVFIADACAGGTELGCIDAPQTSFEVLATAGDSLFVFVSASSLGQEGPFVLTLQNAAVSCGDTIVDNAAGEECDPPNGVTCNAQCKSIESDCENQIDDDNDGTIDCQDPNECQNLAVCTPGVAPTGDPCAANTDCATSAGNDPFCFTEALNGFPAGYCSEFCSVSLNDCAGDSVCIPVAGLTQGADAGLCVDGCNPANGNADCARAGYSCQDLLGDQTLFGCQPACSDNAQCQTLAGCNIDTGFCVATLEDCSANQDEDNDTFVNCEDADCRANVALCPLAAECAAAAPLLASNAGNTVAGTDDFRGSCLTTGNAKEQIFSFVTPGNITDRGFVTLQLQSLTPQGVYVRQDCVDPASELTCFTGALSQTTPIAGGTPLSVFVDAAFPGAEGPFTLTLRFDLINEVEPNNSSATANAFSGVFVGESNVANDQDFISVNLPANIVVSAQLNEIFAGDCVNNINSRVELRDIDGTTIIDTSEAGCQPAVGFIPVAGTYFIRVFGASNTFPYELLLTQTPVVESEANNSAATANPFSEGFLGGLLAGDQDFVSFSIIGNNATLIAETTDVGSKDCVLGDLDTQLTIFDTDGTTQIVSDDNNGAGNCSLAIAKNLAPGTYFIRVTATDANAPYRLAIKEATEVEPNDDAAAANNFSSPFFGAIESGADEDFIQINVVAGASLRAEIFDGGDGACFNSAIDSELELSGPGLAQPIKNDDKASQNFCSRIEALNLQGGLYTLRVGSSQFADPNGTFLYQLDLQ